MNLAKVNLNLLVALDALLTEKNVTRAGRKVFITQSAMSSCLNNIRKLFNDEIMIRGPGGMVPTPLGEELGPRVKQILAEIDTVVSGTQEFDPKGIDREFVLGVSGRIEPELSVPLYNYLQEFAPKVRIVYRNFKSSYDKEQIHDGVIDLGVDSWPDKEFDSWMSGEYMYTEEYVCAAHKDHPLIKKALTTKEYNAAKHLLVFIPTHELEEKYLRGLTAAQVREYRSFMEERKVEVMGTHGLAFLDLLENTDLLSILPKRFVDKYAKKFNLATQPTPFPFPETKIHQLWAKRTDKDRELTWLRGIVKNLLVK